MDSGGYRITVGEAECESICKEAMNAAEHRLQPGVQLRFCPEMDLPFSFQSDALRIQQVLTNLLTNACKHTPAGEIRLSCSLEKNPGMLTFCVEDTGPGIPPSEAQRIFERFVKLDDFVQGTGLGLSICREITAKMGGKIYLDTTYSPGARFVFAVPL
jgi:signal transduction histidine kinase